MRFVPSVSDFEVEEVPLRRGAAEGGPHLWIEVEKRDLSTADAIRMVASVLGISAARIGHAGQKDAHARTTQWLSIEGADERALPLVSGERLRVLRAERRPEKLAVGAISGNRFVVRLRDVTPSEEPALIAGLGRLAREGVPNVFGAQRFGIRGLGAAIGKAILLGEARLALDLLLGCARAVEGAGLRAARERYERGDPLGALRLLPPGFEPERRALARLGGGASPREALDAVPWKTRELYLSAYQASLFNRLLEQRESEGGLAALERGDVAIEHATGMVFRVEDPGALAEQVAALAVSAAGPLFGYAVERAEGMPGAREAALLEVEGVDFETFRRPRGLALRGARRPYRTPLTDLSTEADPKTRTLTVRFFLPPGAYATAVVEALRRSVA